VGFLFSTGSSLLEAGGKQQIPHGNAIAGFVVSWAVLPTFSGSPTAGR